MLVIAEGAGYYASDYVIMLSKSSRRSDFGWKVRMCRKRIGKVVIACSRKIIQTTSISLFILAQTSV